MNKSKIIIIGLAALAIGVTLFFLFTRPPELVSSSIEDGETQVDLVPKITLTFSGAVDPQKITVLSTPEEPFEVRGVGDNTVLIFQPEEKPLFQSTQYSLDIFYRNRLVDTVTFTTLAQQSDPRVMQEIQKKVEEEYPLAHLTPYSTDSFRVVYLSPLTLSVELYPGAQRGPSIEAVKAWVRQNGVDPNSHEYAVTVYSTPEPTTYSITQ